MPRNGSAGAGVESRLGERDSVFPPSPGEVQREKEEKIYPLNAFSVFILTVNLNKLLNLKFEQFS